MTALVSKTSVYTNSTTRAFGPTATPADNADPLSSLASYLGEEGDKVSCRYPTPPPERVFLPALYLTAVILGEG